MGNIKKSFGWGGTVLGLAVTIVGATNLVVAAQSTGDFSLRISPSPLFAKVKPGVPMDIPLSVRNSGANKENLQIALRSFTTDKDGQVVLGNDEPKEIANWISFSQQKFTVDTGQEVTDKVHVALPKDTGFSYSFAVVISRSSGDSNASSGASLHGSVADFALINVDKPGATRRFDISSFTPTSQIFEYLPATFNLKFQNTGNTIVQPAGNIFIQRGSDDKQPLATIPVNPGQNYIIPNQPRTLTAKWDDGFPSYKTTTDSSGKQHTDLVWDWSKLMDFRFGQYTAKLVAVYNDGTRDVPVVDETTFWVIPWRAILVLIALIVIVVLLFRTLIRRRTHHAVKKATAHKEE